MKKIIFAIIIIVQVSIIQKTYAQTQLQYDFSHTCITGQELYYKIIDQQNHYVALVNPSYFSTYEFAGCTSPSGFVYLPDTIYYNGVGYVITALGGSSNGLHPGGVGAFFHCQSLTSVRIPPTVTYIGDAAFAHDTSLTSISIPFNCTGIGTEAFFGCKNITDLTICYAVTEWGGGPFNGCTGLTYLTIDNPHALNALTLENCPNLQYFGSLPSSYLHYYTSIDGVLFNLNRNEIVRYPTGRPGSYIIPSGVSIIRENAFNNCDHLTSITIPSSVDHIMNRAFAYCDSLTLIVLENTVPPSFEADAFDGLPSNIQIQVPCGSISTYQADSLWSRFTNYVSDTSCVTYNIQVTSNDSIMGTTNGGGEFSVSSYVTLSASPNTGYQFLSWSDGDTNNPRTITVTQDSSFTAIFSHITYNVNVNVLPTDLNPGSVSISGPHHYMEYDTLYAYNNYGYHFVEWRYNYRSTISNPILLLITSDTTIRAVFEKDKYCIYTQALPREAGSVLFDCNGLGAPVPTWGYYSYLDTATFYAIPKAGMTFVRWGDGNTENPRKIVVTSIRTMAAYFSQCGSNPDVLHDTTYIDVHDTTYINVPYPVHDTTFVDVPYPVHDTTYVDVFVPVHDTTYIDVHDTTYVDVPYPVHDTSYIDVYVPVHDTTYVDVIVPVHDTTYVDVLYPVHDTTYVDVFVPVHDTTYIDVHDTTYVDVPYLVHDTTYVDVYVPVHDTTYVDVIVPVHDTTYVDVPYPVHDTTYIDVHDTTYIDVPYPVHDTTYVDVIVPVHDTTYIDVIVPVHDTTYVDVPYPVYDTTYVIQHDTVTIIEELTWFTLQVTSDNISMGIAAGSGEFPEGTNVEIAAIAIEGNRFLQWSDGMTENPRTVTMNDNIMLTAQFETVGVENYTLPNWYVYTEQNVVVIKGASGHLIRLYDSAGRLLQRCQNAPDVLRYTIDTAGIYLIQLDNGAAKKVSVVKD